MVPMLARMLGPKYDRYPCFVQPKLNGIRALFQQNPGIGLPATWQSRDEILWSPNILGHLTRELFTLDLKNLILDGELYVHGWRLQRINSAIAVKRVEPTEDTPHVCFHIFDIVDPTQSFSGRWLDFYNSKINLPHIKIVPTSLVSSREEVDQHFRFYTAEGYEGVMLRPDGPYEFGEHFSKRSDKITGFRSKNLWKYKSWEDGEFYCIGTTQGEGKADIGIGALVLECIPQKIPGHEFDIFKVDIFKVGTGFDDFERIAFAANPPIGKLIRIRYLELTKAGIPFNPSFIAVLD